MWNTAVTSELVPPVATWICWTSYKNRYAGLLVFYLLALAHRCNVASLSLSYRYWFGRCSSEQAQLVPFLFSRGRSSRFSDRLRDFSVTIPGCYKDVYVSSLFLRAAKLWNSLPIECCLLTDDLSGFKSKINRHLLTVSSF